MEADEHAPADGAPAEVQRSWSERWVLRRAGLRLLGAVLPPTALFAVVVAAVGDASLVSSLLWFTGFQLVLAGALVPSQLLELTAGSRPAAWRAPALAGAVWAGVVVADLHVVYVEALASGSLQGALSAVHLAVVDQPEGVVGRASPGALFLVAGAFLRLFRASLGAQYAAQLVLVLLGVEALSRGSDLRGAMFVVPFALSLPASAWVADRLELRLWPGEGPSPPPVRRRQASCGGCVAFYAAFVAAALYATSATGVLAATGVLGLAGLLLGLALLPALVAMLFKRAVLERTPRQLAFEPLPEASVAELGPASAAAADALVELGFEPLASRQVLADGSPSGAVRLFARGDVGALAWLVHRRGTEGGSPPIVLFVTDYPGERRLESSTQACDGVSFALLGARSLIEFRPGSTPAELWAIHAADQALLVERGLGGPLPPLLDGALSRDLEAYARWREALRARSSLGLMRAALQFGAPRALRWEGLLDDTPSNRGAE